MISYCESCFQEMNEADARWCRVCHLCFKRYPVGHDVPVTYDNKRYGVWDHLQSKPKEATHAPKSDDPPRDAQSLRVRKPQE